MTTKVRTKRVGGDDGVSLILALFFVTIAFAVVAAMLTLTGTSLAFSRTAQAERARVYTADSAVQGGIANARYNLDAGVDNLNNGQCAYALPVGTLDAPNITLTCAAVAGSGGVAAVNQPKYAVQTLGTNTSEGFQFSGKSISVQGGIFSTSVINPSSDITLVNGSAYSRTSTTNCVNNVNVTSPWVRHCVLSAGDPQGADPGYLPLVSTAPAAAPAATCLASKAVLKFYPGKYTTPPTNPASGNCANATEWFSPGFYYFAFTAAQPVWNVDQDVVGGTASTDWTPNAATASGASLPSDGVAACDDSSASGVQFAFGGDSRLAFGNNSIRFELCASYSTTSVPIAIYEIGTTTAQFTAPSASGCLTKVPYPSASGSCAFIDSTSNKPDLAIHGATYAPPSALDIHIHNLSSYTLFEGGVISRALFVSVSPSAKGSNYFALKDTARSARRIDFTANSYGNPVLRARVRFDDGANGATPGTTAVVESWSATP